MTGSTSAHRNVDRSLQLLYVLTAYPPSTGGAQIHHHLLAQEMMRQGHEPRVITLWDTNRTDWLLGTTLRAEREDREYSVDGVRVRRLGLGRMERLQLAPSVAAYYALMDWTIPAIARHLEGRLRSVSTPADIVHNVRIGREPLSFAALAVARRQKVPFVLTPVHHPRWRGWRYRWYDRLYREADALIALTEVEAAVLASIGVERDRITVTGIGPVLAERADPRRFRAKLRIEGPIVLFVGQHYPYKGYAALLAAAPLVWRRVPEAHFVFIGPGVGRSERAFEAARDPRIHRLGSVSLQDKTDAFAACDAFCLPSTQESFGGVYTEAWTFGKPVVGCQIPAVQEIISDGVDGYLVEQSAESIAERVTELLSDRALRDRLGAAGRQKVHARYNWKAIGSRTLGAYAGAIRRMTGE